jgi:hypothetical protein
MQAEGRKAARIFPERMRPETPRSEAIVRDALADGLDDSFVIFHSVAWHRPVRNHPDGEADLLVAHPDLGALVLEVKGGGIEYDFGSGGWASTEGGRRHRMESPFDQAKRAKHALIGEIKEDVRWPTGRSVQMGWAVVFPDIPITASGFTAEGKRDVTLGKNDLAHLGEVVVDRLRYWQDVEPRDRLGEDGVRVLVERYGRTWRHEIPLKDVVAEEVRRIVELTEQQMEAFHILARQRRAAIAGCAGSGKTLIAVAWARELAEAGSRVLLTCFNRGLSDYWERTLELPDRVTAMNYHQFCKAALSHSGVRAPSEIGEGYMDWVASYGLLEAAEKDPELRFDGIIVDEAQDFEADWLGALEACLSGPEARFFVFYDDNQRLYSQNRIPESFGVPFVLGRNVRNPDPIGELVRQFYPGAMRLSEVPGEPVQPILAEAQAGRTSDEVGLKWVFESLRKQGADPADVVVLSPVSDEDSRLFKRRRFGSWSLYRRQKPDGDVLFETIRSFKGQDRPIVILAELDQLSVPEQNAEEALASLLYVGCSRATNRLYLLASEPWENLLNSLNLSPIRTESPA